jgi:hypothetical protein
MASSSKKKTNPVISDFAHQDLLNELGKQYKNLSSTAAKLSKEAGVCDKALSTIAYDLCPVVCANLISSYNGLTSSAIKVADAAVAAALRPVEAKFGQYCGEKYSCDYRDRNAAFEQKSSDDADFSGDARHDNSASDDNQAKASGETHETGEEL